MPTDTQPITEALIYPESDGQPMAENTKQFRWIVTIQGGLDALFQDDPDIFVAGDLFWYPKGDRGSYLQWREEHVVPQVVFEVLSLGNTLTEMVRVLRFYERYGVEEYYIYDPDHGDLSGWIRGEDGLIDITSIVGWVSPRLSVRFELQRGELQLYRPDGRRFATYLELEQQRAQAEQRAEQERQRAEQERQQREVAQATDDRLAAQLRALGVDPGENR